ncbi:MAG: T9SS C-terminal target domain-containing protein [Bacteroidetes bacterium]|nr:T9SS C-terminal target domain-containing protein [Bacteroidota bacterium]
MGIVDRNMAHSYTCVDAADNSLVQSAPTQIISPFTALSSRTIDYPSFAIPVRNSDSLNLDFTYIIQANPDDRRANDTLRTRLSLWNDYAYDDGTAETGYGINLLGTSIAYKFYVATPDTLRGVWMYFIEAAESAARELFNLKVWSRIGENSLAGGETMLTQMERQKPQHSDSLGVFVFYPLDTPVLVRDSFYVGWQQLSTRLLNIGLDRNSPVQGVKWTSVQGTWQPSSISGSWMIRPVLDDSLSFPAAVHHRKVVTSPLFYPNPTNGLLRIRWDMLPDSEIQENKTFQLRLRDIGGRIVEQQTIQTQQNPEITEVANGLYFLELSTSDRIIHTQKILIQR